MPETGRWRIIAHMPDHTEGKKLDIDTDFVDRLITDRLGFDFGARDLSWTSQFVLKQGVAKRYRHGRVFIAGDAAHLHSPVGGQGLNTGAQDAHALLWRIALAERAAPEHDALLDSYEAERRPVAVSMVKNTTRATKLVTLHSGIIGRLRAFVARHALQTSLVQNQLGRPIGMLELAYKDSPVIVAGTQGTVGPGDRLPNPGHGRRRLHDLLDPLRHTILLLDPHGAALAGDLRRSGMACVEIGQTLGSGDFIDADGALREALGGALLVVVRPDRVIAVASDSLSPAAVHGYARNVLGISPQDL
jgi:NADPH-dependent dioxygenase